MMRISTVGVAIAALGALACNATGVDVKGAGAAGATGSPSSQLVFTSQPSSTPATQAMATFTVAATDNLGNTDTSFSGSIAVAIAANPAGGALSGTTSVPAIGGVSTFSNLRIDQAGTGYTLTASTSGLTSGTSASFDITP